MSQKYPTWYGTLFASDTLERFGFYAMQAILVLYAAAPAERGGLGLPMTDAASLFGAWIGLMFLLSLPGGWLGDRVLGQLRALQLGAGISTLGYLLLALPAPGLTAAALGVLALGGGLYKPNHQAMLNLMYGRDVGRREAGISLMYTGTQVSALAAPLLVGFVGERVDWHLGFGIAMVAMLLNLVWLVTAARQFGTVGAGPVRLADPAAARQHRTRAVGLVAAIAVVAAGLGVLGALSPRAAIAAVGLLSVLGPIVGYTVVYRSKDLGSGDRRRLRGYLAVFLGATLFWMIIAHAASLLNLFAKDHVDRDVLGWTVPTSWMMVAAPVFILLLAPVFAWLLPRIGGAHHVAVKFGIGLTLVGGSFLLMALAAAAAADGALVSPWWLVVVYLAHACGELTIAAVTIASAGEVLPRKYMARTLGLLWLFAALGGGLGAGVVRLVEVIPEPVYYLGLGSLATLGGIAFFLGRERLTRALAPDDDSPEAGGVAVPSPRPDELTRTGPG